MLAQKSRGELSFFDVSGSFIFSSRKFSSIFKTFPKDFRFRRKHLRLGRRPVDRGAGSLEPPDLVVTEMQRVSRGAHHGFLTTPLGVFGRVLDSAQMYEGPRTPRISCFGKSTEKKLLHSNFFGKKLLWSNFFSKKVAMEVHFPKQRRRFLTVLWAAETKSYRCAGASDTFLPFSGRIRCFLGGVAV